MGYWLEGYPQVLQETALALAPLLLVFGVHQALTRHLRARELLRMLVGVAVGYFGLTLFLQGVYYGYLDAGRALGSTLAASPQRWLLVPFGCVIGLVITLAEPAIYVLVHRIEEITHGSVPRRAMMLSLAAGVSLAVGLSMLRMLLEWPLWTVLTPGYVLALVLSYLAPRQFAGIAFDSGGVASGTMTVTFVLAVSLGVAEELTGSEGLAQGFGTVAVVSLFPILTVLGLGLLYGLAQRRAEASVASGDKPPGQGR